MVVNNDRKGTAAIGRPGCSCSRSHRTLRCKRILSLPEQARPVPIGTTRLSISKFREFLGKKIILRSGFTRSPRGRLPRGIACLLEPVFHQQKPAKHLHHSSSAILCRWFNVLRGSDPVLTAMGILGDNIAASVAKNAAIPGAAQ